MNINIRLDNINDNSITLDNFILLRIRPEIKCILRVLTINKTSILYYNTLSMTEKKCYCSTTELILNINIIIHRFIGIKQ